MPSYKDSWTSPGLPALIQITINDPKNNILLETSVIPGLMPPVKGPAAVDHPTTDTVTSRSTQEQTLQPSQNIKGGEGQE